MPLARIADKLVCFAHVPRCGGTSMELYLALRFGPLALHDNDYLQEPEPRRWTRTAPQHAAAADLARLFPPGFLDASFALVRDPLARLKSVFLFQRDIEATIPPGETFETWLAGVTATAAERPFQFDNHTRPMARMVPGDATVFRLEDGMSPVVAWLDGLAGAAAPELEMPVKNDYAGRISWAGLEPGPAPVVTDRVLALVAEHYAEDYERFGYAPGRTTTGEHSP